MIPIVTTIEARCKMCYSCIRRCPASAIRVENGQATVMPERCIACGYCVKVCPQKAKQIRDGIAHTRALLQSSDEIIAILAPSFPAAFVDVRPFQVVAGLRKLGFSQVYEVALGADMVGEEYAKISKNSVMPIIISSPCPAIVNYIEKYYPELILTLAPVVSPMIALGRLLKQVVAPEARIVFIGPCIAKKREREDPRVAHIIDEVLTFEELVRFFEEQGVDLSDLEETPFDGPEAGIGRSFALSGGLLETAGLPGGTLQNDKIVTEGRDRVIDAIKKVAEGKIEARFLDLLFCEGCINGPQMVEDLSVFVRKDRIINFFNNRSAQPDPEQMEAWRQKAKKINLRREFTSEDLSLPDPTEKEIREILSRIGISTDEDELNCGACGYPTCREKAVAVYQGIAEVEMCLPYMIEKLQKIQKELTDSNEELRTSLDTLQKTQQQLLQSEKMASVGQLAAGVAHELNNPLGGILIYANLMLEKMQKNTREADDLQRIMKETERCRGIVRGLLDFSRQTRIEAAIVDINQILNGTMALVTQQALFHNIKVALNLYEKLPKVFADVGQMQQVFLNIILNAVEAMEGKGEITVTSRLDDDERHVLLSIEDSGPGMSEEVLKKIFDPFFTTKPQGKGTGLGLAIAYGIVQKHKGEISVRSRVGQGSAFTVRLPIARQMEMAHSLMQEG
ncbi:4Fe-4S binding protein [candidate division KSB1 bacterium]|nr:4Fe-4S binding protein [candidate division KSB1 bacterium]